MTTEASCVSVTAYSGYIGTSASASPAGSSSTVTLNAPAATDPLADMNPADSATDGMSIWNPGWTTPRPIGPGRNRQPGIPNLGYNKWSQAGVGDCLVDGDYNAGCELDPNYLTGMSGYSVARCSSMKGTNTGTTYITGGFSGRIELRPRAERR